MGDAGAAAVDLGYARSRLLGAPVRKQLGGAWLKGRVIAEEAEASDGETDFRVVYEDGEETVMPESEVRLWAAACGLDLGPSASGDDGDESCEEAPPAEPPPESAQPMTSAATPSPFTQPGHVQPLSSAPIPPSSRTSSSATEECRAHAVHTD
ncbi:unnamed protein product [Prorocentrum cordatum]|uniref:Tudor domain-containing protein n=1 Tax=Prorocentrum cordatum TaxID=2364126 RepID=A0ABN9U9P6_9DINO|nr:unnamed protein product [Polarella glacialis]